MKQYVQRTNPVFADKIMISKARFGDIKRALDLGAAYSFKVSDIIRAEGEKLLGTGKLSHEQAKTVFSIVNCRTRTYGYHAQVCNGCGHIEVAYNSCRNRHCPQCQGSSKRRRLNDRLSELLPVAYYHDQKAGIY